MKLGIIGGSFNPIHLGHLFLADQACSALGLDRVVFIPAFLSPFKLEAGTNQQSNAKDRIDMTAAAISGDFRYAIDNCEIKREGISYTINTIEDIIERYLPAGKPVLIIGDDLVGDFPKWRKYERILELAEIAVVRRFNSEAGVYSFPCIPIDNEMMDISSSKVRRKISEGSEWRSLVPSAVRVIIEDRRLYGYNEKLNENCCAVCPQSADSGDAKSECTHEIIQRVEDAARRALSTDRFLHSRNTALAAVDLCRRFGLDPMAGYLAGIAHDLAKQTDGRQLLKIVKSRKYEFAISSIEKNKPGLLHGKAAAVLLREQFCIHNNDVLEAVACHTFGSEKMGPLAKVIYIADKTECLRVIDPVLRAKCFNSDHLRSEADLDNLLFAVLEKTIGKLKARELNLSKDTLMLLEKITNR